MSARHQSHFRQVDLLSILVRAANDHRPLAYCRIVETRGSTPQKAGALMLVAPDGTQFGTIGGGCIEAEVKSRAQQALASGKPELATFQLNGDYGWGDGLICGGRMRVAIEPVRDESHLNYFQPFHDHIHGRGGATETIFADGDSSPSYLLFDESGKKIAGIRDDVSVDVEALATELKSLDERPRPYSTPAAAFVPIFPRCRLVIVGCGHVGMAVGQMAAELDFDICAVDDRQDYASRDRFPQAGEILVGPVEYTLPKLELDSHTYCLIVTRGHKQDEQALYYLIDRGARYIGLIGSRRKINLIFEDLIEMGVSEDTLAEVHAPVGIDIGSQTVPEIAISIAAELVAHRNKGGRIPGRWEPVRAVAE